MAEKKYPPITVTDDNDEHPRGVVFEDAFANGWNRQCVAIYLFDQEGRVFLQCRSKEVKKDPDQWSPSAGGHVDFGLSYHEAACEELREELGLDLKLSHAGKIYFDDPHEQSNSWQDIYVAQYCGEELNFESWEVNGGKWFPIEEVDHMVEVGTKGGCDCTPVMQGTWKYARKNYDTNNNEIYPDVMVSDENDENENHVRFAEAILGGMIRRISIVCLLDRDEGKILLQRRSDKVRIAPGKWASTAAGQVNEGQTYETAAHAELFEEVGVTDINLTLVSKRLDEYTETFDGEPRVMRVWNAFFVAEYSGQEIVTNDWEVGETKWFTRDEIDRMIVDNNEQFISSFVLAWPELREKLF